MIHTKESFTHIAANRIVLIHWLQCVLTSFRHFKLFTYIDGNERYEDTVFSTELSDSSKWMSTLGGLLGKTKREEKYISEESLPGFSMSHYVSSAIQNSDGSFWLDTFGGGLNHIGSNLKFLKNFKQNFSSEKSLSNNFVECLIFRQLSPALGRKRMTD